MSNLPVEARPYDSDLSALETIGAATETVHRRIGELVTRAASDSNPSLPASDIVDVLSSVDQLADALDDLGHALVAADEATAISIALPSAIAAAANDLLSRRFEDRPETEDLFAIADAQLPDHSGSSSTYEATIAAEAEAVRRNIGRGLPTDGGSTDPIVAARFQFGDAIGSLVEDATNAAAAFIAVTDADAYAAEVLGDSLPAGRRRRRRQQEDANRWAVALCLAADPESQA